jgi:hypothetical protein
MVDGTAELPGPPFGVSILIWGTGETPMAILASALAQREQAPFTWVHCSEPGERLEEVARRLLVENSATGREEWVDPAEWEPPSGRGATLSDLIVPESISDRDRTRLVAYLALPSLLQRLASRSMTTQGRTSIVLTNIDALVPPIEEKALGRREVHAVLHGEGVTLVVTYRGAPSAHLQKLFDEVYAVDAPQATAWADARITRQRGDPARGTPAAGSLREWMFRLGVPANQMRLVERDSRRASNVSSR